MMNTFHTFYFHRFDLLQLKAGMLLNFSNRLCVRCVVDNFTSVSVSTFPTDLYWINISLQYEIHRGRNED